MSMMQPRERFLAAVKRQPVDRVPLYDFLFQKPLFTELIGRIPESYNARDALDLAVALGLDAVWLPFGTPTGWQPERIDANVYRDEWGTTFERNASSWPIDAPIDYPLKSRADLDRYLPPDAGAEGRLDDIDRGLALNRERGDRAVAVLGGVQGPLTTAWMLLGYERICMLLYDDPPFLQTVADLAARFGTIAIERMAAAGVDAMIVSEDLGSSTGGLVSPAHFREFFAGPLGTLIDSAHSAGLRVVLHSCGRIYEYLDDVVALGADAVHALQRTAGMDLAEVKARWGDRLALIGNIDSSRTLPYGSMQQIEQEVREAIRAAAPGYGYILGSDHSLHDGIPIENIRHMFACARRDGAYPIQG